MKKRALLFLLCLSLLAGTLLSCADTHVHTYADTWSSSESAHWKADTCGHDTKSDEGAHTFNENMCCTVCGYAMTGDTLSVAQAVKSAPEGQELYVQGLFVGISDEGAGYEKELLLKDCENDQLIAVRGVSYGNYPSYGYEKGDLVRLCGKILRARYSADNEKSQNKTYLVFSKENPENIADTILSRGNAVSYQLENAVTIDSWKAMKTFFNAATLEAYTYVHFKGDVWFNTYAKAADGVQLHRFCMTGEAYNLAAMKPDGKRAVGLRQNMLEANVPAAMTAYFDEFVGSTSYPGKKGTVDFYAVVSATNNVNFQLTILDHSWLAGRDGSIEIKTQQDIVKEVGFAYYRQGTQIYYDQRYRDENPTPEAATAQQRQYLDCSSFVNAVYYEAFGVNIQRVPITERSPQTGNYTSYAKENLGSSPDVIGYWETKDYPTYEQQKKLLGEILAQLQVGDVLTYRHGKSSPTAGHSLLYIGNGTFLHSTGSQATFDATQPEKNEDLLNAMEMTHGTVQKICADKLFTDTTSSRYLFRDTSSDKMFHFCVIRPLALGLTATEKTQNRMKLAGVTMEKQITPGIAKTVARGEEITYTLLIQNHSANSYKDVLFEDTLSEHLTFLAGSEGLAVEGQKISKKLSIGAWESIKIEWTAKVKDTAPVGARIESNATALGGVKVFDTANFVGAYTAAQLQSVAQMARDMAANGTSFADPLELARSIYREALGAETLQDVTAAELIAALFVQQESGSYEPRTDTPLSEIAVPRLQGGTLLHRICDIVSIHTENALTPGDLILCYWSGVYRLFVCVGEGELVQIDTASRTATLVQNGSDLALYQNDSYCINSICSQLRTYELCAVLRPAMKGAQ
jgi:fimbrial isopeptide formation D2 family protein